MAPAWFHLNHFTNPFQGFWDLIFIQMEKFSIQFKELEQLEANEWTKPEVEKVKPVKRVVRVNRPKPVHMEKTVTAAKSRPPLRALIAQKRAEAAGSNVTDNKFISMTLIKAVLQ